jgi:hypothetical protein
MSESTFKVVETSTFYVKTAEQAEYIRKLYEDLQSLITCETSEFKAIVEPYSPPVDPGPRKCDLCDNRAMHHRTICDDCEFKRIEKASLEHINSHY